MNCGKGPRGRCCRRGVQGVVVVEVCQMWHVQFVETPGRRVLTYINPPFSLHFTQARKKEGIDGIERLLKSKYLTLISIRITDLAVLAEKSYFQCTLVAPLSLLSSRANLVQLRKINHIKYVAFTLTNSPTLTFIYDRLLCLRSCSDWIFDLIRLL